jgi:IgA Peptidase M64/Peptidase M64 N-terminus
MRNLLVIFTLFVAISTQAQFDSTFKNQSLRLDYYHSGDHEHEYYSIDELLLEPFWGGTKTNLVDTFEYGKYFFKVYDLASNNLIYSRGYSSLFGEWQATEEAKETQRTFSESLLMPFPINDVRIEFLSRNDSGAFAKRFSYVIDVGSYFINPEKKMEYPVYETYVSGDPSKKIDIVILPEGYTLDEMELFKSDCDKFKEALFSFAPYNKNQDKFNIRGVLAPSLDSGIDKPADSVWERTILNASFSTFDSERYCMSFDNKSIRNLAANAPYDQIYILANDPKYGGGGIYNFYCLSVNSNSAAAKIFIHEFGHGFAGLADEYYNTEVAFSEFYPLHVEPWEPNITTLVNFGSKWNGLLNDSIPVPTPAIAQYKNVLGVFEGGGYTAKDVYRPKMDCLMNSFRGNKFCAACEQAIQKMIDFYSE